MTHLYDIWIHEVATVAAMTADIGQSKVLSKHMSGTINQGV